MKKISILIAAIAFTACQSDWRDGIPSTNSEQDAIAFSGYVAASKQETRANSTIVKLGDTQLPTTANSTFYAGLFGCHTGQYTWQDLIGLSRLESPTDEQKQILKNFYTANLLYNAKATIGENGTLTYEPLRFWPNSLLTSGVNAGQHEYCTFWAYYPYNPTAEIGDYGITLIPENLGEGTGMGRVKFTMQPDAANQNDFMISEPVVDCNRDTYPLMEGPQGTYTPKPVSLRFHHMLAQVRIYVFIRGFDRMVYQDTNSDGIPDPADAAWLTALTDGTHSIIDANGNKYEIVKTDGTITSITNKSLEADYPSDPKVTINRDEFVALGLKIPDESKCERWNRSDQPWNYQHTRRRAKISYQLELNNIKTTTTFFPQYGTQTSIGYEPASTLGSATVTDYIMNPYWYRFNAANERDYLNDDYMFGYFEDQDASKEPENNALLYTLGDKNEDKTNNKHYNFSQSNVLLVVPQKLDDEDVPHIVLTAKGEKAGDSSTEYTARLTINMLKMNIEWKSGIIYCYGILDDLRPGDDIVRGPESITTIFDTSQYTDQW